MLALVLLWMIPGMAPANAAPVTDTIDGITYTAEDDDLEAGATVTGYTGPGASAVTIPDSVTLNDTIYPVTTIDPQAFRGKGLAHVTIGDFVKTIGYQAFEENNLTMVTIPDNVNAINASAFASNKLTEVTIGALVETIGAGAFASNELTNVTIPDNVTSIGVAAFWQNQLTDVTIGKSVTIIDEGAFWGNKLTEVTIPDNITTIGAIAFAENLNLSLVRFTGPAPTTIYGASEIFPSLSVNPALIVQYPAAYGEPATPGGYTTPTWLGYATQPDRVTVTFDTAGADPIAPVMVDYGATIAEPARPTRTGFTFTGWHADPQETTPFDFSTPIVASLTLHATWQPIDTPDTPDTPDTSVGTGPPDPRGTSAAPPGNTLPDTGSPVTLPALLAALLTLTTGALLSRRQVNRTRP